MIVDALLAAAWVGCARLVAPRLIATAHAGRSWPWLNRVFERVVRHPLEHYLSLWDDFALAVLLGLGAHAVVCAHGAILETTVPRRWGLTAISAVFLAVTILAGPRQDYVAYLEIWSRVWSGEDPWWVEASRGHPLNAYGPAFTLFAPLAEWAPLAPKLVFATAYLLALAWLMALPTPRWGVVLWALHPSFWTHIAWYGHFDVLVGLACLVAILSVEHQREPRAGVALGLGVSLKYLPLVLAPFLAIRQDPPSAKRSAPGLRSGFLRAFVATLLVGMGVGLAIWGAAPLRAVTFAASRPSQMLSIFRYVRGPCSPWPVDLDWLATPALLATLSLIWVWSVIRRVGVFPATIAAVLATLLLYKVGFAQYQTVLLVLIIPWWATRGSDVPGSRPLRAAMMLYIGWIGFVDVLDWGIGGSVGASGWRATLEAAAGLPTFLLGAWLLVALLRTCSKGPSPPRGFDHPPGGAPGQIDRERPARPR